MKGVTHALDATDTGRPKKHQKSSVSCKKKTHHRSLAEVGTDGAGETSVIRGQSKTKALSLGIYLGRT